MSVKTASTTVHRLPLTKARVNLGSVVRRIHMNKEYAILEKDGIPIVGMMDIEEMEDYLDLKDEKLKKQIAEGYGEYKAGKLTDDLDSFLNQLKAKTHKPRTRKR
ncbi:MAG: hypothetical protein WAO19_04470 [Candidatus Kryptoniota bacterium]